MTGWLDECPFINLGKLRLARSQTVFPAAELRKRIKEDYNAILQKRIAVREAKEIERECTVAISNRTGCIPQTLAGKPFNLMNKSPNGFARNQAKVTRSDGIQHSHFSDVFPVSFDS